MKMNFFVFADEGRNPLQLALALVKKKDVRKSSGGSSKPKEILMRRAKEPRDRKISKKRAAKAPSEEEELAKHAHMDGKEKTIVIA